MMGYEMNVREERILVRGLKLNKLAVWMLRTVVSQRRTNPREGIETRRRVRHRAHADLHVREERILVRGLKPSDHLEIYGCAGRDLGVREERILVRGLKHGIDLLHECPLLSRSEKNESS